MGLFDLIKSKNIIVDNKDWVLSNSKYLDVVNVDETFDFVLTHHPLGGCAQSNMPKLKGNETIGTLAELADAVTVACYVKLGYDTDFNNVVWDQVNATAIGNLAFIAVNHPDAAIRDKCRLKLTAWRVYKTQ